MRAWMWLSHVAFLILLAALPFVFANIMTVSLERLHLSHSMALALVVGIFVGGLVNIPVARIRRPAEVPTNVLAIFGLDQALPQFQRMQHDTIVAVNIGGCVIPVALAIYEFKDLIPQGGAVLGAVAAACLVNIIVCYLLARPIEGVGIAMPGIVPPLVAIGAALLLSWSNPTPVAFIAGVIGPLVGADLLHLKDIGRIASTGVASIGGAGTFDGIVLSGIMAAYLA